MKVIRVISALIALAGLAVLAFGIREWRETWGFLELSEPSRGEVTAVDQHRGTPGRKGIAPTFYSYKVRFKARDGSTIEEQALTTSSMPRFSVGESLGVRHFSPEPQLFMIDHFAMLWGDSVMLLAMGLSLLLSGATGFWIAGGRSERRVRNEAKLGEMAAAWRAGRLTRNSEYQGLLVAFAYVGFPLLAVAVLFVLIGHPVTQVLVGAFLVWIVFSVIRRARSQRQSTRPRRSRRT